MCGEGLQTEQSYSSMWIFNVGTNSMQVCSVLQFADSSGIWVSQHFEVSGKAEQPAALLLSSKKYQCFHQQDWRARKHCFQKLKSGQGATMMGMHAAQACAFMQGIHTSTVFNKVLMMCVRHSTT